MRHPKTHCLRDLPVSLICLALILGGPVVADALPITNPMVFIQYSIPDDPQAVLRGNLYRLDPDGTVSNLTNRNDVLVRDPEVSYDATRVVFAMRVGPDTATWQVWEIGIDGSGLRLVSRDGTYNDMDPSYLPDGRIIFTTDRLRWSDGYENVPTAQLAVMSADGTGVEVLKVNTAGHLNPVLGSNGMIYMTQWDFHDRRKEMNEEHDDLDVNRFLLWQVFADGSGLDHPLFGAHTIEDFTPGYVEVRERPNAPGTFVGTFGSADTQELSSFSPDRLIFVPGNFHTFEGAQLVRMEPQPNQNDDAIIALTPSVGDEECEEGDEECEEECEEGDEECEEGRGETQGFWRSPLPLADGRVVASYTPDLLENRDGPQPFQLWVMNDDGSGQELLYADPELWSLQAVEVVARTPPALAEGEMKPLYPYAIVNAFDVTLRENDQQPNPSPGQITEIRVLREDVRTPNTHDQQVDGGTGTGAFDPWDDPDTEVIGTAPVAADESFAVIVPVDTPLTWELLDAAGNVIVRERFGTELRAGEIRQCAGCHTPHDGTEGSTTNFALDSPTNLSGQNVDLNDNGIVDLLEGLCETMPQFCSSTIFADGFESGDVGQWSISVP